MVVVPGLSAPMSLTKPENPEMDGDERLNTSSNPPSSSPSGVEVFPPGPWLAFLPGHPCQHDRNKRSGGHNSANLPGERVANTDAGTRVKRLNTPRKGDVRSIVEDTDHYVRPTAERGRGGGEGERIRSGAPKDELLRRDSEFCAEQRVQGRAISWHHFVPTFFQHFFHPGHPSLDNQSHRNQEV